MKIPYRLGVNMRRRARRLLLIRVSVLATVLIIGALSITYTLHGFQTQAPAELAHRNHRWRSDNQLNKLATDTEHYHHEQWLHVERINDNTPPAVPSDPASSAPYTALISEATSMADVPTNTDSAAATVSKPTSAVQTTAVQAPVTTVPTAAVVVAATPLPVVTVATNSSLPQIVVPISTTADLTNPQKKDIAMQLVSSAENSSLDWQAQYGYLEDIDDGRGYTGGIVGFTSGTGDMLELLQYYTKLKPSNVLAQYIPALQKVNGSDSHNGLGASFEAAWKAASSDLTFQQAQNEERDRVYFNPAVAQAKQDGLRGLGQFMYYDALVMHGPGDDATSFGGIREAALKHAKSPDQGGDEKTYLNAFLNARVAAMQTEAAHDDVSRVETEQRVFLAAGNFDLNTPLTWQTYGDSYKIQ